MEAAETARDAHEKIIFALVGIQYDNLGSTVNGQAIMVSLLCEIIISLDKIEERLDKLEGDKR